MATSTIPEELPRTPLGVPPGSVRAALTTLIMAIFWLLLLLPKDHPVNAPLSLYFLMSLVLAFFVSHGGSIDPEDTGHPSPWHLPAGTFRFLIVLGTIGVVGWQFIQDRETLMLRLTPDPTQLKEWPRLFLALSGGFIIGHIARLGPWRNTYGFQDFQAWVSLIAMLLLVAEMITRLFIAPNLEKDVNLYLWEPLLVAIVAFYFGVRA